MNKKGDTIPFQWLFISLAGAFIIFIFTLFISSGIESSQISLDTNLLLHFNTIFSTLATSEMTQTEIPLNRDTQIRFTCDLENDLIISSFQIAGGIADRNLRHLPVYSHERMYGTHLLTKTENIAVPFTVASALYVTDSETQFILYHQSKPQNPTQQNRDRDKLRQIQQLLPNRSNSIIVTDFSDPSHRAYTKLVIITIDEGQLVFDNVQGQSQDYPQPASFIPDSLRNAEFILHADIHPNSVDELYVSGLIRYKTLDPQVQNRQFQRDFETVSYQNRGMLAGALLSPSKEFYDCTFAKTIAHIQVKSRILAQRADILSENSRYASRCGGIYQSMRTELESFANQLTTTDISQGISQFHSTIRNIRTFNERLSVNSCPVVY